MKHICIILAMALIIGGYIYVNDCYQIDELKIAEIDILCAKWQIDSRIGL